MSLCFLFKEELKNNTLVLDDARATHIIQTLRSKKGDELKVGQINANIGSAIVKELKENHELTLTREKGLLKKMMQAAKGASRAKYLGTSFWQLKKLVGLLTQSKYPKQLLRAALLGIPLYLILGKGENFFKL